MPHVRSHRYIVVDLEAESLGVVPGPAQVRQISDLHIGTVRQAGKGKAVGTSGSQPLSVEHAFQEMLVSTLNGEFTARWYL